MSAAVVKDEEEDEAGRTGGNAAQFVVDVVNTGRPVVDTVGSAQGVEGSVLSLEPFSPEAAVANPSQHLRSKTVPELSASQSVNAALPPGPSVSPPVFDIKPPTINTKPHKEAAPSDAEAGTNGDNIVIVMVGLPARGKTYIGRRVVRYLRFFHGAEAEIFNAGNYRRKLFGAQQGHGFFDPMNSEASEMRVQCAKAAMSDLKEFLNAGLTLGRVAVFDATNTTRKRRQWILDELLPIIQSKSHVIFVESVCTDENIIDSNIREVKLNMPDYKGMGAEAAVADFKKRIDHYKTIYEPINDENLSWIRLVDGGRQVTANRVKGFLATRILQFLSCLHTRPRPIYLSRHGQSEYNKIGKIGGDSGLSKAGLKYARRLAEFVHTEVLNPASPITHCPSHARLWRSSLKRTGETIQFIKHDLQSDGWITMRPRVWRNLDEIFAGVFDGFTYEEIQKVAPAEFQMRKQDKLSYRYPRGESYLDVITRLDPLIHELERQSDPLVICGHQGVLRIIYAYLCDLPREEAPFISVPLNHVLKLVPNAYGCDVSKHCLIHGEKDNVPSH